METNITCFSEDETEDGPGKDVKKGRVIINYCDRHCWDTKINKTFTKY